MIKFCFVDRPVSVWLGALIVITEVEVIAYARIRRCLSPKRLKKMYEVEDSERKIELGL